MRSQILFPSLLLIIAAGCSSDPTSPDYDPELPAAWAPAVTNPLFPLVPGMVLEYEGTTDEGVEVTRVEVLSETRVIQGVTAMVVKDQVYLDGELVEDTRDWFAQDADGNVWYLGEDTKELENGVVVSTEGSWEWGVDGALPGIIMWADPAEHVGEAYRQEFYEAEAEDWGKVLTTSEAVSVPQGPFSNCVKILEWNGLESGSEEYKFYCPQVGMVLETAPSGERRLELVSRTAP